MDDPLKKKVPSDIVATYLPEGTSYRIIDGELVFTLPDGKILKEGDKVVVEMEIGSSRKEKKG